MTRSFVVCSRINYYSLFSCFSNNGRGVKISFDVERKHFQGEFQEFISENLAVSSLALRSLSLASSLEPGTSAETNNLKYVFICLIFN